MTDTPELDVSEYFAEFNPTQKQLKRLASLVKSVHRVWGSDYWAAERATLVIAPGELSQLTPAAYDLLKRCQGRTWAFKVQLEEKYGVFHKQTYGELFNLLLSLGLIVEATPRQKLKGRKTVKELCLLLKAKHLPIKGKKDELVDRAVKHLSPAELDALVADVILFRTTEAGEQATQVIDELRHRMSTSFFEAAKGTVKYSKAKEEPPPVLPPGVLYEDKELDFTITEADVDRAIEKARRRVGPEFARLLEARTATPADEAEIMADMEEKKPDEE